MQESGYLARMAARVAQAGAQLIAAKTGGRVGREQRQEPGSIAFSALRASHENLSPWDHPFRL